MSIEGCLHSLFGASKVAADVLTQEYGRYFDMKTAAFRGGCLTGPHHSGVELHGFLSYLVAQALAEGPYTIFGYKGKQVRDQLHSADVVSAFWAFAQDPRPGEVYNLGGGKANAASLIGAGRDRSRPAAAPDRSSPTTTPTGSATTSATTPTWPSSGTTSRAGARSGASTPSSTRWSGPWPPPGAGEGRAGGVDDGGSPWSTSSSRPTSPPPPT